jgi:di/tricarboxylate transporter
MNWQAWVTSLVLLITILVMATDRVTPALALLGADVTLLVFGVISVPQALAGFANPAPITVAALFVVARAVEKTGALQPLISTALGSNGSATLRLARLLVPTAGASAFLNNTPIVAVLAPQVADWAERRGKAASAFLMPISFATILGGTVTLIGTSTNLVVSGLLESSGKAPIGMFEITRVGLPVAIVGLLSLVILAPKLLPERRTALQQFAADTREFTVNMLVVAGSALDGQTVERCGLRSLNGVFLAELEREGEVVAPVAPTTVLHGNDRLTFVGRADMVRDLQAIRGLVSTEREHATALDGTEHTFFEVVLSSASPLVGKTLREGKFRGSYQAAVLAMHRAGARVNAKLGSVRLKEGDTLLVISDRGFRDRWRDRNEFLLVAHLDGAPIPSSRQAILVAAILAAVVLAAALGMLPILQASLLGAMALMLGSVLTPSEARSAIDLDVLLVIAAAFGVGTAMQESGLASRVADGLVHAFSPWGPVGALLAVTLSTVALTELITNNAAAVLMFPIGMAAAATLGLNPRAFAIALTIAASASFLTPIGYQTNTMVYGLGGYRFGDFARLGLPLTATVIATIVVVVPLFWPLCAS